MESTELLEHLKKEITSFVEGSTANYVFMRAALSPSAAGLKLFDDPLIEVCAADDPLFEELNERSDAGRPTSLPADWLAGATCVISYFLPLSERVRQSNYGGRPVSVEWLHSCMEGKMLVLRLGEHVERLVRAAGYEAVCPACHPEMNVPSRDAQARKSGHISWSDRRAAYVSGLGTFALSGGVITEKGTAGRLGSVVVSAPLPVTQRPYSDLYGYCTRCGACVDRCPAGALSLESGKDHRACHIEMQALTQSFPGYLGCGKCKVDVPCECQRA